MGSLLENREMSDTGPMRISDANQGSRARDMAEVQKVKQPLIDQLAQARDRIDDLGTGRADPDPLAGQLLQALLDNIPDFIFFKDRNSRIIRSNGAHARYLGVSDPKDVVGKSDFDFAPLEDAQRFYAEEQCIMASGQPVVGREWSVPGPEGEERWLSEHKFPISDEAGRVIGLVGISQDITARKQAEKELDQALMDLERSNKALEHYAYIVSHDLQEPLRMVSSYLQLLQRRYEGQLDEDADDFIGFAVGGAHRMRAMINGLLDYSRVGTRSEPFQSTDCGAALDHALANLEIAIEESEAQITHDDLPTVMADETQLVQLFQNLISNAIKFRRDDAIPRVHISVERQGNRWVFGVEDSGIGIDSSQFERIFQIFQRLHSQKDYEGTGIGLAVCRKIVECHGGRIWVESEPGKGATFRFTLPADSDAPSQAHGQ